MVLKMKDQESEEEIKEAFKVFDKGIQNKKNKKFNKNDIKKKICLNRWIW